MMATQDDKEQRRGHRWCPEKMPGGDVETRLRSSGWMQGVKGKAKSEMQEPSAHSPRRGAKGLLREGDRQNGVASRKPQGKSNHRGRKEGRTGVCSSVVVSLPSMHKAVGSIVNAKKIKVKRNKQVGEIITIYEIS